jgi:hypothetical protein
MWKRRKSSEVSAKSFPPELLAEARATPGGHVRDLGVRDGSVKILW